MHYPKYYINITKINPHLANQFRAWKKRIAGRDYMTNLSKDTGIQQSKLYVTVKKIETYMVYIYTTI
ncbi:zinc finger-like [Vaccinia virus]|uniref:Zinc finger-like n=1 Tax=Vaccinia virus TaxID=10245 RepID=H2DYR5_VACCV|nr:zinc finger-like [Vaccinia virus]AEY74920.1 zinc finger-like [Vaccinia virus]